jgi:hypothetical protein
MKQQFDFDYVCQDWPLKNMFSVKVFLFLQVHFLILLGAVNFRDQMSIGQLSQEASLIAVA